RADGSSGPPEPEQDSGRNPGTEPQGLHGDLHYPLYGRGRRDLHPYCDYGSWEDSGAGNYGGVEGAGVAAACILQPSHPERGFPAVHRERAAGLEEGEEMWSMTRYHILLNLREKAMVFWTLAFPLLLGLSVAFLVVHLAGSANGVNGLANVLA